MPIKNSVPLRVQRPVVVGAAAEQQVDGDGSGRRFGWRRRRVDGQLLGIGRIERGQAGEQAEIVQITHGAVARLFNQRPHGQAVHQPTRSGLPNFIVRPEPAIDPAEQNRFRLAGTGRGTQQVRKRIGFGEPLLVRVWLLASCPLKKVGERRHVPPQPSEEFQDLGRRSICGC